MSTPAIRALVTGGSGDIGGAICRQLAADGCHVIVHSNGNRARADAVV
jgi:3-oxoacyl-[acyl-carrier protein] reductase